MTDSQLELSGSFDPDSEDMTLYITNDLLKVEVTLNVQNVNAETEPEFYSILAALPTAIEQGFENLVNEMERLMLEQNFEQS